MNAVEPLGCVHCGAVQEVHVLPTLRCPDPRLWTTWQAPTFTRHCEVNLTGVHIYRREGEDPSRAYCACGDSRLRDGVPIDLQSERERRRG